MTQKNQEIIRWVLLGPALCVVWFLITVLSMLMLFSVYGFGNNSTDEFAELLFLVFLFVLHVVVPFFVAWGIAPKYKKIAGICAVVVIVLFQFFAINDI